MDISGTQAEGGEGQGSMDTSISGMYTCNGFSDIATCFAKLHVQLTSVQSQVGTLTKTVSCLEAFAENTNASLSDLHEKILPNLETKLSEKITEEENNRLKLDMWTRKWNLVIRGVDGPLQENPRVTEKSVRQFMAKSLGFDAERAASMLLTAVHRLPGGTEGKHNIIIRLSSLLDRDEILEAAFKLRPGCGISVVPDLPPSVSKHRAHLLKTRKDMSPEDRSKYKLVYMKEFPFVDLIKKRK